MPRSAHIIWLIAIAQFACTSIWFAGNAVVEGMQGSLGLPDNALGPVISSVQAGFIIGTLTFAFLTIADRFSPSKVFFVSALIGAAANVAIVFLAQGYVSLLLLRGLTGFMLAGIYPIGMKIASDYHRSGLGKALGFLVGALVLGKAFPHLLNSFTSSFSWETVLLTTSGFAVAGGLMILIWVPDGPYRKKSHQLDLTAIFRVFKNKGFRSAAFGYFGHMWELYAFWVFIPTIILAYRELHGIPGEATSFLAFGVIAVGGLACMLGGYLSAYMGSRKVAFVALFCSGLCCLISPLLFQLPAFWFYGALFFWGMMVVADSPQMSTLVAQSAPQDNIGSALTIVNCIGFAITIFSIQLINDLIGDVPIAYLFWLLVPGPIFGLIALWKKEIDEYRTRIND